MVFVVTGDGSVTSVELSLLRSLSHLVESMEIFDNDESIPLSLIPTAERLRRILQEEIPDDVITLVDMANDCDYLHCETLLGSCVKSLCKLLAKCTTEELTHAYESLVPQLWRMVAEGTQVNEFMSTHALKGMELSPATIAMLEDGRSSFISFTALDFHFPNRYLNLCDSWTAAHYGDVEYFKRIDCTDSGPLNTSCARIALMREHYDLFWMLNRARKDCPMRTMAVWGTKQNWLDIGEDMRKMIEERNIEFLESLVRQAAEMNNQDSYVELQRLHRRRTGCLCSLIASRPPSSALLEIDGCLAPFYYSRAAIHCPDIDRVARDFPEGNLHYVLQIARDSVPERGIHDHMACLKPRFMKRLAHHFGEDEAKKMVRLGIEFLSRRMTTKTSVQVLRETILGQSVFIKLPPTKENLIDHFTALEILLKAHPSDALFKKLSALKM